MSFEVRAEADLTAVDERLASYEPTEAEDPDIRDDNSNNAQRNWPDELRPEALHGVAGELVRTIEPHSEADPAALLLQFLIGFGNVIGRQAHFMAEADRHFTNLFTVIVGQTAKGRKGTSL